MPFQILANKLTPWLAGNVPTDVPADTSNGGGIVISTRIRLARNLLAFPFPNRCTVKDRKSIRETLLKTASKIWNKDDYWFVNIETLDPIDRQFLLERQLISKEIADMDGIRSAIIQKDESSCVMINEEDHVRLHFLSAGFDPQQVWERANRLDDQLAEKLEYAFSEQYGYLTACPTNVGTGIRVSVMMHLPALVFTKEIDKVFRSLQKVHLAVRGLYGEGTQAFGDLFQVSNQVTLGQSESEIIEKMLGFIPQIIDYERQTRDYLLNEKREVIQDRCCRAFGLLQTACTIESVETMHHLSNLRLGIHTGLIDDVDVETVNMLLLQTQPAHLQKLFGEEINPFDRDVKRAKLIREKIHEKRT